MSAWQVMVRWEAEAGRWRAEVYRRSLPNLRKHQGGAGLPRELEPEAAPEQLAFVAANVLVRHGWLVTPEDVVVERPPLDPPNLRALAPEQPGRLELRSCGSCPRHYLAGKLVECGVGLQLQFEGNRWVPGRYQWTFDPKRLPRFHASLGQGDVHVSFDLPDRAVLRWPVGER